MNLCSPPTTSSTHLLLAMGNSRLTESDWDQELLGVGKSMGFPQLQTRAHPSHRGGLACSRTPALPPAKCLLALLACLSNPSLPLPPSGSSESQHPHWNAASFRKPSWLALKPQPFDLLWDTPLAWLASVSLW